MPRSRAVSRSSLHPASTTAVGVVALRHRLPRTSARASRGSSPSSTRASAVTRPATSARWEPEEPVPVFFVVAFGAVDRSMRFNDGAGARADALAAGALRGGRWGGYAGALVARLCGVGSKRTPAPPPQENSGPEGRAG